MPQSNERSATAIRHLPGDHVRWFASRMNWPIVQHNVLVEGNDSKYFAIAARLYREVHKRDLLDGIAVFPTGDGDEGGTFGILRHFPTIRSLIDNDLDSNGNRQFAVIALMDSDSAGKNARNGLTAKFTNFLEFRDVFLLQRRMPRSTRDPGQLARATERENQSWKRMDCEIEDLLSVELLKAFVERASRPLRRQPEWQEGGHHFEFHEGVKPDLLRFVSDRAGIEDVQLLIDVLKSLRYYLGLSVEGKECP